MSDASQPRRIVKSLIQSIQNVMKAQCKIDVTVLQPFLKNREGSNLITKLCGKEGLRGQIEMISSDFEGHLSLVMEKSFYLKILNKMLGENFTEIKKETEDGIAELTNIIYGLAKKELNDGGLDYKMARPYVDHVQLNTIENQVIVLLFKTELGHFHVELSPKKLKKVA